MKPTIIRLWTLLDLFNCAKSRESKIPIKSARISSAFNTFYPIGRVRILYLNLKMLLLRAHGSEREK